MLDGAVKNAECKMVIRKKDITDFCKIDLRQEIVWNERGTQELLMNRKTGMLIEHSGIVVADYEHYIVVRTPKGYNVCLEKNDIATGQIVIKGFKPKVPRISCYEAEQEKY